MYVPGPNSDFGMQNFSLQFVPVNMVQGMEAYAPIQPDEAMSQDIATAADPVKTVSGDGDVHTVMMRNIPNKYSQQLLIEEINNQGFAGTFDFIYLPVDPDTDANRGYAFVNFDDPSDALRFKQEFDGRQMALFDSNKVVNVMPATLQGFEANYAHYSNARVNRSDPERRPFFLREPATTTASRARKRGGRRHGKSLIDIAMRDKDRKAPSTNAKLQDFAAAAMGGPQVIRPHRRHPPADTVAPAAPAAPAAPVAADDAEETRSAKFCPMCGGSRDPGDKFCTFCGAALK
eukprot:gnl/TRDRNA2_/TRDRNA2_153336_c1_seq2.p2 gnl/TRDRNA2_/TRDRNA2_153336_c1~~gnl/TRDRNA2_/TRDRNA2_153336_c1_seq2.p2  ORF type:complete len:290 (-),score=59.90 gnl/TRDRNA2_/TRDRNA2_153336_c1_seq2:47-916(-)